MCKLASNLTEVWFLCKSGDCATRYKKARTLKFTNVFFRLEFTEKNALFKNKEIFVSVLIFL